MNLRRLIYTFGVVVFQHCAFCASWSMDIVYEYVDCLMFAIIQLCCSVVLCVVLVSTFIIRVFVLAIVCFGSECKFFRGGQPHVRSVSSFFF